MFLEWNIRFVSIVDNADTEVRGNKKARQINGLINEWYLEDMSENIKSVLSSKRSNGLHVGSFALYGYVKDSNKKGHLLIDEEAATVVREVFSLFAQGYGKSAIARILNEKGLPNPTEYKRLHGYNYKNCKRRDSSLWRYHAISSMLTNEIYIGNMVQGRFANISYKTKKKRKVSKQNWTIVQNTHEPIIDKELWNQVQSLVKERFTSFKSGKIRRFCKQAEM